VNAVQRKSRKEHRAYLDGVCRCGHTNGQHFANRQDDGQCCYQCDLDGKRCKGFKAAPQENKEAR